MLSSFYESETIITISSIIQNSVKYIINQEVVIDIKGDELIFAKISNIFIYQIYIITIH